MGRLGAEVVVAAAGGAVGHSAPALLGELAASLRRTARAVAPRAEVEGRVKSPRSTLQKMRRRKVAAREIHDRLGLRVLVDEVPECFAVLRALHDRWDYLPGHVDDYIRRPKPNGYQSLHTTLVDSRGLRFEVQIRTRQMHEECERGPAAHWRYKSSLGWRQREEEEPRKRRAASWGDRR